MKCFVWSYINPSGRFQRSIIPHFTCLSPLAAALLTTICKRSFLGLSVQWEKLIKAIQSLAPLRKTFVLKSSRQFSFIIIHYCQIIPQRKRLKTWHLFSRDTLRHLFFQGLGACYRGSRLGTEVKWQSSECLISPLNLNVLYECSLLCVISLCYEIPSSRQCDPAGVAFPKQQKGFYWNFWDWAHFWCLANWT